MYCKRNFRKIPHRIEVMRCQSSSRKWLFGKFSQFPFTFEGHNFYKNQPNAKIGASIDRPRSQHSYSFKKSPCVGQKFPDIIAKVKPSTKLPLIWVISNSFSASTTHLFQMKFLPKSLVFDVDSL